MVHLGCHVHLVVRQALCLIQIVCLHEAAQLPTRLFPNLSGQHFDKQTILECVVELFMSVSLAGRHLDSDVGFMVLLNIAVEYE